MTDPDLLALSQEREQVIEAAGEQLSQFIVKAMRNLPPRDLQLLDYRAAGRRWSEIAEETGTTETAVRQQWVRAKRRIRTELRAEFLEAELWED